MPPLYNANTTMTELVAEYTNLIQGKVVLTTGVTLGSLGGSFVEAISKAHPSCLILAGRSAAKLDQYGKQLETVNPGLKIITVQIDLGSLASVRKAADYINTHESVPVIDVLVNNAGIMAVEYSVSEDGIESQLATNHIGPFLFTNLIMEKIMLSKSPRIVMVSSDGHRLSPVRFDDYNFDDSVLIVIQLQGGKTYNKWVAYGQAKTANMLMALSLSLKLAHRGLQAFSLHPGVIFTNLGGHLDWNTDVGLQSLDRQLGNREGWQDFKLKTLDSGAATHVYAAFDPALKGTAISVHGVDTSPTVALANTNLHHFQVDNGAYLIDSHVADPLVDTVKPWATSSFEAERLWKLSETLVGQQFAY
ncbi:unnamed protein product [Penicillium salamii]|nr:unnamed protein product [Penicillium salamii]CAG8171503.1 unnamed protein product [Penicillium salamii]CAG8243797.1 unnamed protein product [Penicillium salamii]